jgi:DNA-binding NarL/FixJ family response regulator
MHGFIETLPLTPLTPFERRILRMRAEGLSRSEIAFRLGRSPQTISNTLTVAKEKLGARSVIQAAVRLSTEESSIGSTAGL